MLKQITIHNFAIFKSAGMEPEEGYNVITGESGAGKSVVVNALSLLCGARAYREMIRPGRESAVVEAVFSTNDLQSDKPDDYINPEDEGLLVITREIHLEKPSVCKINGKLRNLSDIAAISEKLIDIHGQYENQSLLDIENHKLLIDGFAAEDIDEKKKEYNSMACEYKSIVDSVLQETGSEEERAREREILEFQISEIERAALEGFDEEGFQERISLLENAENFLNGANKAMEMLDGDELSTVDAIREASKILESLPDNRELGEIAGSLDETYFKLRELLGQIRGFVEDMNFSPEEYEEAIETRNHLKNLKRKYGATIEEILEFRNKAGERLDEIDNFEINHDTNLKKIKHLENVLTRLDGELTAIRKTAAEKLCSVIVSELTDMGMKEARLETRFTGTKSENKLGFQSFPKNGRDTCEFLVSLNKGITPMSLGKVASGGELSRIMLAFKTVFSGKDKTATVVFDEIDSGISGNASIAVANKLKKLSADRQVICITHQPQIAAKADCHFTIDKGLEDDISTAYIKKITDKEDIIRNIASLTDGESITSEGRVHAEKLYDRNNEKG